MYQGKVKFFKADKNYGFITPEGGGKDIFVHSSACKQPIKDGDVVNYDTKDTEKGPTAINVELD